MAFWLLKSKFDAGRGAEGFFTRSATNTWCKLLEALPSLDHCAFPDLAEKDLSDDWLEWSRAPGMADE